MSSVVLYGGVDVTSDGAASSPTFALICCFVDHYFGPRGGNRISVEVMVPEDAGVG